MSALHVSLIAEPIAHIGSFAVTNSLVNALATSVVLIGTTVALRVFTITSAIPGRLQNAFEWVLEFLLGYFDRVTGSRAKSEAFLPLVGTLFLFILLSNWMGLLPGTGSIVIHGAEGTTPLFRPATADLNLTLALALVSVVTSHIVGIIFLGLGTHLNKFIQLGTLYHALRSMKPMKIITAVIELGVGFLELIGELTKVASLSLRLFGNIFAGEVLLTVMASLISYIVPLPFMLMEVLVGFIQASVFSMLTLVYLTVMTTAPHQSH